MEPSTTGLLVGPLPNRPVQAHIISTLTHRPGVLPGVIHFVGKPHQHRLLRSTKLIQEDIEAYVVAPLLNITYQGARALSKRWICKRFQGDQGQTAAALSHRQGCGDLLRGGGINPAHKCGLDVAMGQGLGNVRVAIGPRQKRRAALRFPKRKSGYKPHQKTKGPELTKFVHQGLH